MKKKIVIIIVAVVLALALLITGAILLLKSLFNSDMVITVGDTTASVGDTVKIPVKISGNKGFMAMLIDFEYDTEVLKYKSYQKGDFLTDYELSDNNGNLKFMNLESNDVDDNGVLLYLEFEVISDKASSTEIKLNIGENSICNYNEEIIEAKSENGTVKISK